MDKGARAARLADQIRDYIATWLYRDYLGSGVSVSSVQLSRNQQLATIWLILPVPSSVTLREINHGTRRYQQHLHQALQRTAVPTIRFLAEDTAASQRIDQLLNP